MSKIFQFGENVQGFNIPVLNEREIRAAAGIYFFFVLIGVANVNTVVNFHVIKYTLTVFLFDMMIRVFINPRFSPSLILGRFFVRNQNPEYVGAPQKRYAWVLAIILSATVFVHMVILDMESPITGLACFLCMVFLFFEAAFGICVGCKMYSMVKKDKAQYCPGEVCDPKLKQPIQKISALQAVILVLALVGVITFVMGTKQIINPQPTPILGNENVRAKTLEK